MRPNYIYSSLIIISIFIFGCEKVLETENEASDPKLSVSSFFQPDTTFTIYVANGRSVFDMEELSPIENATIKIFEDEQLFETLTNGTSGFYTSTSNAKRGKNYRIEVSAPNYETVIAEDKVYDPVSILSMDTMAVKGEQDMYNLEVTIHFNDFPNEDNYYGVEVYLLEDSMFSESYPTYFNSNNLSFDNIESDFDGYTPSVEFGLLSDRLVKSTGSVKLTLDRYNVDNAHKITVRLYTIGEAFYHHRISREKYLWTNGDPFAQPVQVFSNVENGFGIFAGYSFTEKVLK